MACAFSEPDEDVSCRGNECAVNGGQCAARGQTCVQLPFGPCMACSPFTCASNDECPRGTSCVEGICDPTVRDVATSYEPNVLTVAVTCGNGAIEQGEECDDRNNRDLDGCSADCLLERGLCGDGVIQALLGEECEPSTHDARLPYGCSGHCKFSSMLCGNGVVDPGEDCDLGVQNSNAPNAACRTSCAMAQCGDGILDGYAEECDDGNRVGGDGCSRQCRNERGAPPQNPLIGQSFDWGLVGGSQTAMIPASLPQTAASGPAAITVMAAGAAGGVAWMRRKGKKPQK